MRQFRRFLILFSTIICFLFPGNPLWAQSPANQTHFDQIDQKYWQSELYLEKFEPLLKQLFSSFKEPGVLEEISDAFHPLFQGMTPLQGHPSLLREEHGVKIEQIGFEQTHPVSTTDFMKHWAEYVTAFQSVHRVETHIGRVEIESQPSEFPTVTVKLDTLIAGKEDSFNRTDQGKWKATLIRIDPKNWKLKALIPLSLQIAHARPVFTDITSLLPASYKEIHPETFVYNGLPALNGVSLADWDQDGDLDIYVFRPRLSALFYENDGQGHFKDISSQMPGSEGDLSKEKSGTGYFVDMDNDGDLDFLELRRYHPPRFFKKQQGEFIDFTQEAGLADLPEFWWVGAAIADYDLDGDLDIYLLRYKYTEDFNYFNAQGTPNFLLRNDGKGRFKDVTSISGMDIGNDRLSFAAAWADYNEDGYPDLYVANDYGPNKLYTNQKNGTFVEEAEALNVEDQGNGMGVVWGDYDNDGHLDLYVSNMHSYAGERITHNLGNQMPAKTVQLIRRFAKGNTLFRYRRGQPFEEATPGVAVVGADWAWSPAFFDYDHDGDLDLYVTNGYFSNSKQKDT